MYSKILIGGRIETVTGLHIGTGGDYSAIGTADSPVIRDAVSRLPMIPGSSLKGKLRSLLARKYNARPPKPGDTHDDDDPRILRLFGSCCSPSRLVFSDMPISNIDELRAMGIYDPTEIKFENTINRFTSSANPRQIERVIRQCRFDLNIIYNAYEAADITADISLLADGIKLLEYDYLGGHGSRGYAKVKITGLSAQAAAGDDEGTMEEIIEECNIILEDAAWK
ncbi:MAG: type III-A CRISPR-associated RAMP protein Csm3 [Ruminococcus sp.]|nr:type III-A CRISPR-associated RAMP protein Csm3 [Ruminococcus sp.]